MKCWFNLDEALICTWNGRSWWLTPRVSSFIYTERVSDRCKKHYMQLISHLSVSTLTPMHQLGCASATFLIVSFLIYHSVVALPPSPFHSPLSSSSSLPSLWRRWFHSAPWLWVLEPQGSRGEDASQGAVWCLAFCGPACPRLADRQQFLALGGTNRSSGGGGLVYLKFSHPQNTWSFRFCTDMFKWFSEAKKKRSQQKWRSVLSFVCICKLCDYMTAVRQYKCSYRWFIVAAY